MRPFLKLLIMFVAQAVGLMLCSADFAWLGCVKFKLDGLINAVFEPVLRSSVMESAKPKAVVDITASRNTANAFSSRWAFQYGLSAILVIMLCAISAAPAFSITDRALFPSDMVRPVFRVGLAHNKIFWSVVRPLAIYVVYDFVRLQKPAKELFHNKSMLHNVASATGMISCEHHSISIRSNVSSALPAGMTARVFGKPLAVAFPAYAVIFSIPFLNGDTTFAALFHCLNDSQLLIASQIQIVNTARDEGFNCTPDYGAWPHGHSGSNTTKTTNPQVESEET